MSRQVTERFFCDFCGAENAASQFTKVEVRGCINGPEHACPRCLRSILEHLGRMREQGGMPSSSEPAAKVPRRWWWQRFEDWVNRA